MRIYDMRIEDIVEALNLHIEYKRKLLNINSSGHVVLQKTIKVNPTFKAYKEYEYILWFVKSKYKCALIRVKETAKVIDGLEEAINRRLNIELGKQIFNLIDSNLFKQVIQGEYADTIK